jgi:hypothetical protein
MKRAHSQAPDGMARAEVCLGTDWFAAPRRRLPHPAWCSLVGFGAHLMAGVMRLKPATATHRTGGAWRKRRNRTDIQS